VSGSTRCTGDEVKGRAAWLKWVRNFWGMSVVESNGLNLQGPGATRGPAPSSGADGEVVAADSGRVGLSSRIPGFSRLSGEARVRELVQRGALRDDLRCHFLATGNLSVEQADQFIENCVGCFSLPLGIATNFMIDGEEILVPMAVEESSVVAAASHGAKMCRSMGGFFTEPTQTIATCQVQIFTEGDFDLESAFREHEGQIMDAASGVHPRLQARGGGVVGMDLRSLPRPGYWVLHIHVDTREAMGANIVNTIAEHIGGLLPRLFPCEVGLKILTNLCDRRVTTVRTKVAFEALAMAGFTGEEAARRIEMAWEFADLDPYRAATHNKGVMNGIDPVVIATGNDWRAVEAGCHAYAACDGRYKPMTTWKVDPAGFLAGEISVPIAVGTVGGVTRIHDGVQAVLHVLGNPTSDRLSGIIAAVGLAQNLSALRALACEGIQKGHMALHERNLEMLRRYDDIDPTSV
jgi:hydroxymethylglutaryl-CoA reductase